MEAKETVMSGEQIEKAWKSAKPRETEFQAVAQAQAEITWDIAFRAGEKQCRESIAESIERQLAPEDTWFIAGRKWLEALKGGENEQAI